MRQFSLHGAYLCPLERRRQQNNHGDDAAAFPAFPVEYLQGQTLHENSVQRIKVRRMNRHYNKVVKPNSSLSTVRG